MMKPIFPIAAILFASIASGHEGHSHAPSAEMQKKIEKLNTDTSVRLVAERGAATSEDQARPEIASYFEPFSDKVQVRFDNNFLYVESDGMPDHPMMIGITAWQQQVPLPQSYTGGNAWRIPLRPVAARQPMSAKTHFFRGAIALAVNGVPIFNPIKNDGKTDTLIAGELDQWGGHCGRADDYHYHIAPVHLEKIVGKGNPVGVALDGYPIYGYVDPDGSTPKDLDWLNGHKDSEGHYHYHATKTYPYLNGGFYGEVVERDGQVDPQPRADGVRPALPPLRGAKITGFSHPKPGEFSLQYDLRGEERSIQYNVAADGSVAFRFVSQEGTKTETYTPRPRGGGPRGGGPRGGGQRGGGQRGGPGPNPRGGGPPRAGGPPRNDGPRGPQPGDGPRQPWILVHAEEIDINHDRIISRAEIVGEATQAFAGYDADKDGQLSQSEYGGRGGNSRSAMGGFIRGHASELDRDGNGILSRAEVVGNAERMFDRIDADGDGKIVASELEASRRSLNP